MKVHSHRIVEMKVHSLTRGVEYFISRDEGTLTDKRSRILH